MFIYFWEREGQSVSEGGVEREGDTESEAGSTLWAVSTEPDTGLEPRNGEIMTWAEVGFLTDWAIQMPPKKIFKMYTKYNTSWSKWKIDWTFKNQAMWFTMLTNPEKKLTISNIYSWQVKNTRQLPDSNRGYLLKPYS